MRLGLSFFLFLSVCLISFASSGKAETWKLPQELNDTNTTVSFSVDSTWHRVEGRAKGIAGSVKLGDRKDPLSIVADVSMPVALFSTAWESRDERLLEVMAADTYPTVRFISSRLSHPCDPAILKRESSCRGDLEGILTIRDIKRSVKLPLRIVQHASTYEIEGEVTLSWGDFNVEDPSILIAKLDPTVTVLIRTTLSAGA